MLAAVSQPFANYQNEIYLHGLGGTYPELPCEPGQLEDVARERMDPAPFGYVAGSAGPGASRGRGVIRSRSATPPAVPAPSRRHVPTAPPSTGGGSCPGSCATCRS